jgi:ribosomal protein L37E
MVIRCEQCGSREWVVIQDCRVCARCGAVRPEQRKRELVPAWPNREEHVIT